MLLAKGIKSQVANCILRRGSFGNGVIRFFTKSSVQLKHPLVLERIAKAAGIRAGLLVRFC